ncbi:acyl-homoserine-lactone synthase [Lentibacter sp. XHP0401]|uniref:acyl-homoserine-lactone synthase n=1 Tax=Lentibacter sp. XHP0401 TaxID=2984334 RepID=UPI0021E72A7B|nr:acyl-homoserine-lactone synthase [Lentibacter sp. XHP0401]MCV2894069.1 autoinducer synthase [Lentibacter sp. XHP0401]
MIRFLYANELGNHSKLAHDMFVDRAKQFKERLGWDVHVDRAGEERDQYDMLDPLYVIWEEQDGGHGGSMRFLPTTGRTMTNEHFLHLTDGVRVESPFIWECTRFCLTEGARPQIAAALMLAGSELMRGHGVEHFLGVFDAPMERVYRHIGASPEVLGSTGAGRTKTSVGLWAYTPEAKAKLVAKAGLSEAVMRQWYERAFGQRPTVKSAVA